MDDPRQEDPFWKRVYAQEQHEEAWKRRIVLEHRPGLPYPSPSYDFSSDGSFKPSARRSGKTLAMQQAKQDFEKESRMALFIGGPAAWQMREVHPDSPWSDVVTAEPPTPPVIQGRYDRSRFPPELRYVRHAYRRDRTFDGVEVYLYMGPR